MRSGSEGGEERKQKMRENNGLYYTRQIHHSLSSATDRIRPDKAGAAKSALM